MSDAASRMRWGTSASAAAGDPPRRLRVDIAGQSHRGRVRETNEDAFIVFRVGRFLERIASNIPESEAPTRSEDVGHLMIVADGLGGHEAGEVASATALSATLQLVLRSPRWAVKLDDPATRDTEVREMRQRAMGYLAGIQDAVRRRAAADPRLRGMATTLTGAYAVGDDLFLLHVGDSKAFLLEAGRLRQITRDHTLAQEFVEEGGVSPAEVAAHPMAHMLTRAIGGSAEDVEGDWHELRVRDGDRLLLCTDGLTNMASVDEIAATLAAHPGSEAACAALVSLALERGGRDNVTVIVAGFAAPRPRGARPSA